jgi:hypothetical protein
LLRPIRLTALQLSPALSQLIRNGYRFDGVRATAGQFALLSPAAFRYYPARFTS